MSAPTNQPNPTSHFQATNPIMPPPPIPPPSPDHFWGHTVTALMPLDPLETAAISTAISGLASISTSLTAALPTRLPPLPTLSAYDFIQVQKARDLGVTHLISAANRAQTFLTLIRRLFLRTPPIPANLYDAHISTLVSHCEQVAASELRSLQSIETFLSTPIPTYEGLSGQEALQIPPIDFTHFHTHLKMLRAFPTRLSFNPTPEWQLPVPP